MSNEHRRAPRAQAEARFTARDSAGGGTLTFTSADISEGGTFLRSDLLLEVGEALSLRFEIPGNGEVTAQARVAWVRRFPVAGQVAGMGVEFTVISDDERNAIRRW